MATGAAVEEASSPKAVPGYGNRIRRARLDAGKTQAELAGAINVSLRTVIRYENEQCVPHDRILIAIAKVTRTKASWILYGDD
jgi:transcriptional regulator with XRE-family HTH domain